MRSKWVVFFVAFFPLVVSYSHGFSAPTIGQASHNPSLIHVGLPTPVTTGAEFAGPNLIEGSVNLFSLEEGGKPAVKAKPSHPLAVAMDTRGGLIIAEQDPLQKGWREWAIIGGRVTDSSTGLPLSEVMVTVKTSVGQRKAKTDSNGRYIVFGLIPGKFTATFEKSGYFTQTVPGTVTADEARPLNIQLAPVSALSLTITSPPDGAILNSSPITVAGNVSHPADVVVNGIKATVTDNTFSVMIPLVEGLNPIVAVATDSVGQTASKSIQVTLITKGAITGIVTSALTGLPLSDATVSVTDSANTTKAALTDDQGKYQIADLAAGAFNGSITKDGYKPYPFSGTLPPGQTIIKDAALNPILPVISNIEVSGITTDSASIQWETDQPADSLVEYGLTSSYGNSFSDSALQTTHRITLKDLAPDTAYHFRITSRNGYGFASSSEDRTFKTLPSTNPITLTFTSPRDGDTITRSDVRVEGAITNALGIETGVTVNGILAQVYGNQFIANHVPLAEGSNTITATATDVKGNTATGSVEVTAVKPQNYIKITSSSESGIAPLEMVLTLESSLDLKNSSLTYTGPEEVEFLSRTASEDRIRIPLEGNYAFVAKVGDSGGFIYEDTVSVIVLSKEEINALLTEKWEEMRAKLGGGDIEGSLAFFDDSSREAYRELFHALKSLLPMIAQEMSDIQLIKYAGDTAIYDIRTVRDGTELSFQLQFIKGSDGIWRIGSF